MLLDLVFQRKFYDLTVLNVVEVLGVVLEDSCVACHDLKLVLLELLEFTRGFQIC